MILAVNTYLLVHVEGENRIINESLLYHLSEDRMVTVDSVWIIIAGQTKAEYAIELWV